MTAHATLLGTSSSCCAPCIFCINCSPLSKEVKTFAYFAQRENTSRTTPSTRLSRSTLLPTTISSVCTNIKLAYLGTRFSRSEPLGHTSITKWIRADIVWLSRRIASSLSDAPVPPRTLLYTKEGTHSNSDTHTGEDTRKSPQANI